MKGNHAWFCAPYKREAHFLSDSPLHPTAVALVQGQCCLTPTIWAQWDQSPSSTQQAAFCFPWLCRDEASSWCGPMSPPLPQPALHLLANGVPCHFYQPHPKAPHVPPPRKCHLNLSTCTPERDLATSLGALRAQHSPTREGGASTRSGCLAPARRRGPRRLGFWGGTVLGSPLQHWLAALALRGQSFLP